MFSQKQELNKKYSHDLKQQNKTAEKLFYLACIMAHMLTCADDLTAFTVTVLTVVLGTWRKQASSEGFYPAAAESCLAAQMTRILKIPKGT